MADFPHAYLITFRTYGTWLHGDERGSTDRRHNTYGTPWLLADEALHARRTASLRGDVVVLDAQQRLTVEATLQAVCDHRGWSLLAANARSNHVHAVTSAAVAPEKILLDFKAWSTRRLIQQGHGQSGDRLWSRHGSTRYLWCTEAVAAACHYVLHGQDSVPRP